jgi:hypothetical protein
VFTQSICTGLASRSGKGPTALVSFFRTIAVVLAEPTSAFDALLPKLLQLLLEQVHPAVRVSAHAPMLLGALVEAFEAVLDQHWGWFVAAPDGVLPQQQRLQSRALRSPAHEQWLLQQLSVVVEAMQHEQIPPEQFGKCLAFWQRLHANHALYELQVFVEQVGLCGLDSGVMIDQCDRSPQCTHVLQSWPRTRPLFVALVSLRRSKLRS